MIVAVIDDGICQEEVSSPVEVHLIGRFRDAGAVQIDHDSHGTVCTKIIEKYASPDKIIDIPFLGGDEKAGISDMCDALEHCISLDVDIINLSCGSSSFDRYSDVCQRLKAACRRLYERGVRIFAAQNNRGALTVPALFPYVTSVERCGTKTLPVRSLYRRSDLYVDSVHEITINGIKRRSQDCNSYACAYAAACAAANILPCPDRYMISDTVNADLTSYKHKKISDDIYELYLDDEPEAAGRIYFHSIPEQEKEFLKEHRMRSLVLDDSEERISFIREAGRAFEESEIPFIFIRRDPSAMTTAGQLLSDLLANGYKASVLSAEMADVLSGAYYSPAPCMDDLARIFAYYNKSNALILICDAEPYQNSEDVYIVTEEDQFTLIYNGAKTNVERADRLFQKIIDLFEDT